MPTPPAGRSTGVPGLACCPNPWRGTVLTSTSGVADGSAAAVRRPCRARTDDLLAENEVSFADSSNGPRGCSVECFRRTPALQPAFFPKVSATPWGTTGVIRSGGHAARSLLAGPAAGRRSCPPSESNRRPRPFQRRALPTELGGQTAGEPGSRPPAASWQGPFRPPAGASLPVEPAGIEPAASRLPDARSTC